MSQIAWPLRNPEHWKGGGGRPEISGMGEAEGKKKS